MWESTCTEAGYDALDGARRPRVRRGPRGAPPRARRRGPPRLTGTKHPDSTAHRAEQLARALRVRARGDARPRARGADVPRVEPARRRARGVRGDDRGPPRALLRGPARLRGPADQPGVGGRPGEGRPRAPPARARPRRGPAPPLPRPEPLDRAGRGEDLEDPRVRRARERALPARVREARDRPGAQRDLRAEHSAGERARRDRRRRQDRDALPPGRRRASSTARPSGSTRSSPRVSPPARRADVVARVSRVRLVPLVENVGALAHLPDLLEAYYQALERNHGASDLPTPAGLRTGFDAAESVVRVFVAMSDTAEQSGKIATDAAYTLTIAARDEAERRLAERARRDRRARAPGDVPDRRGPRRVPRRLRPGARGRRQRSSRARTASRCRGSARTRRRGRSVSPRSSARRPRRSGRRPPSERGSASRSSSFSRRA